MGHENASHESRWAALDDVVTEVVDTRREIARLQAKEAALLATSVDLALKRASATQSRPGRRVDHDLPIREASAELATAMRMSDRAVQVRMGDAATLTSRFRDTHRAWEAGVIDAGHVSAILDAGAAIGSDSARARFESQALEIAATQSPTRLRSIVRAIAAAVDPDAAERLRRNGREARAVRIGDLGDGMARLTADLPAPLAYGIYDRLTQMARAVRDAATAGGDTAGGDGTGTLAGSAGGAGASTVIVTSTMSRTFDQTRADVLADLLLAGAPAAHGDGDALASITAHVQVTVPAPALAGLDDSPALLAGYGPIDPDLARRLAAMAPGWDRVFTSPQSGAPLAVDRYRPSNELRRFLGARDEHCRFPGCRVPARRCDIDHTVDAAWGGTTSVDNLAHFCRRHHTLKHATDWTVRQVGEGVLEWTSPAGRQHLDRPAPTVRFVPSEWRACEPRAADPPPF